MDELKLEDLVYDQAKFKLRSTGKTYKLRSFTLEDQAWLNQTYGVEKIKKIFNPEKLDIQSICEIVYHQLSDKSDFKKKKVKIINEEGDELSKEVGGVKLLKALVSGLNELQEMMTALTMAFGIPKAKINSMVKELSKDLKKKQAGPK